MVEYDPLVTLATEKVREPIATILEDLGACTVSDLAFMVGQDESIVAGALRRMADEGLVSLDPEERRVSLNP